MKDLSKIIISVFSIAVVISLGSVALGDMLMPKKPEVLAKKTVGSCITIQEGTILNSSGEVLTTGFDEWGYNYQARMFNGDYCDAYRNAAWCQSYKGTDLIMKWNDAWLSNMDCTGDGLLDRHFGSVSYKGSGAWLTNHMSGSYEGEDGETHNWVEFVKIVAVPENAQEINGMWFVDGKEMGQSIWGEFAIVEDIYNDPYEGYNGKLYLSPSGPGFGKWK